MKIFLDDVRNPPDSTWKVYREVCDDLVKDFFNADEVSLDHDLGENKPTGYDFLCMIEALMHQEPRKLPIIYVHSANPVGVSRMLQAISAIKEI